MIDAIAVGTALATAAGAEAALCRRQFAQALSRYAAALWPIPATSLAELARLAVERGRSAGMPDDARILLVAHDQLYFAPGTLETLDRTLGMGCPAAAACDNRACAGDYPTLRGMERFVQGCRARAKVTLSHSEAPPLVLLATLDALTNGAWRNAQRIAGAWVHDFSGYRSQDRAEMLALLPPECASLLDVGGGEGGFLRKVKERSPGCRTALVEACADACAIASRRVDRVWQGDFLTTEIDERFDGIAFLDVLEHTAWPEQLLARARGLLQPKGFVLASIPNVGHWSVVADLLEGRWDYAPAGLHCITHLRFFTRKGIEELFAEAGFAIEAWQRATAAPPPWFDVSAMKGALTLDSRSLATLAWHCRARLQ